MNDQLNILKMLPDSSGKLFEMWDMCIRNYPDFSGHVFSSCVYVVPLQACLYNTTNKVLHVGSCLIWRDDSCCLFLLFKRCLKHEMSILFTPPVQCVTTSQP